MRLEYRRPWLYPKQAAAIFNEKRYSLIEASTKSGKTAGCMVWFAEQGMRGRAGRNYWWIAPVYSQTEIAYRRLKIGLPRAIYTANESKLTLTLANGAALWFKTAEKPDSLYGEDVFAAVIDEASRVKEESWHAVRSTLTATKGPIRIIGNVKGRRNWFYDLARQAQRGDPDMEYHRLIAKDAVDAGILDEAEVENARRTLPESVFRELYEAVPSDYEGRVYRGFSYEETVRQDIEDLGGALMIGMDFNVDPMTAVLASRAADQLHVWDEIIIPNGNTEEMASEIRRRYRDREVHVYPDPSGNSRKTSAPVGQTDFTILRAAKMAVIAPRQAPGVADRINEVNALLRSADGIRRLFVHSKCNTLIKGLDELSYKEGTSQPDKSRGLDHAPDALGYLVHMEFPIRKQGPHTIKLLGAF